MAFMSVLTTLWLLFASIALYYVYRMKNPEALKLDFKYLKQIAEMRPEAVKRIIEGEEFANKEFFKITTASSAIVVLITLVLVLFGGGIQSIFSHVFSTLFTLIISFISYWLARNKIIFSIIDEQVGKVVRRLENTKKKLQ